MTQTNKYSDAIKNAKNSSAHPDFITYLEKAGEKGGTPLATSFSNSVEHVTPEKWASRGTTIEESLFEGGAPMALNCGNLDRVNTAICKEIVDEDY